MARPRRTSPRRRTATPLHRLAASRPWPTRSSARPQRWHGLGPPPLGARDSRVVAVAGAVEEALMAIVAGFDVHRAQITFDARDTDSGEVTRERIDATPAAVARWTERFA